MKGKKSDKQERLRKAAIVKMKYQLVAGKLDEGFKMIFGGVLKDLDLEETEVDGYIERHAGEIKKICSQ
ncbi:MAG TPA: hypothetical protein VM425_17370 [Myxococcota bacterium]|nr:hypothetical protein [Myxococcota bacterium]